MATNDDQTLDLFSIEAATRSVPAPATGAGAATASAAAPARPAAATTPTTAAAGASILDTDGVDQGDEDPDAEPDETALEAEYREAAARSGASLPGEGPKAAARRRMLATLDAIPAVARRAAGEAGLPEAVLPGVASQWPRQVVLDLLASRRKEFLKVLVDHREASELVLRSVALMCARKAEAYDMARQGIPVRRQPIEAAQMAVAAAVLAHAGIEISELPMRRADGQPVVASYATSEPEESSCRERGG